MKTKLKFGIILTVEFIAIAILLLLVFFAGKRSYDVTFDLNGGTLISGDLTQRITQGQNATPPTAVKEGHYLHGWSGSYKGITSDRVIKAIWEYETTPGIEYSDSETKNYCEIIGCYKDIRGEIYIGAYHDSKAVLGITSEAFMNCERITAVHLLDGIIRIDAYAFAYCTALESIDVPSTVTKLGARVFQGCESLKNITLPEGLEVIGDGAFTGCSSLESITIPSSVKEISENAFAGCSALSEVIFATSEKEITDETDGNGKDDPELSIDSILGIGGDNTSETVEIPSSIAVIRSGAFAGCRSLEKIILPEELTMICTNAFDGCEGLREVVIYDKLAVIEAGAFDCADTVFYITFPESNIPDGWADGWKADGSTVTERTESDTSDAESDNKTEKTDSK